MVSGAVQTAISTPVDLLKIRQQLQIARSGMASYVGPLQLLRQILKTEGIPGGREHPVAVLTTIQSDPRSFLSVMLGVDQQLVMKSACMCRSGEP